MINNNCQSIEPNLYHQPNKTCADSLSQQLGKMKTVDRIENIINTLPDKFAMTSSFGIGAAVSIHLMNQVIPGIPVILIDTGYLFKETYQYAEQLSEQLKLNLQIHQSQISAQRFESMYGQLWLNDLSGLNQYNQLRKVLPLEQALNDLNINTWFSGVRRTQSEHRKQLPWVTVKNNRYKVHPLLDWTERDMYMYLNKHKLPQHPLFDQGYLSVGDTHSTRSIHEVSEASEMRFFGLKRECGIHE